MTLDRNQIREYFSPATASYWRWEENGRVLAWSDGATICYREVLESVLARLAPHGLPPLGSVLLLLAACRDNWAEEPARRALLEAHLGANYGQDYGKFAADVLTGLGELNWNRHHFRREHMGIAALAEALFEEAPGRYGRDDSALLVRHFREGLAAEEMTGKGASALEALLHDLGCLRWGVARFDLEAVRLRIKTGLEELPKTAEFDPPPPSSARDLINTLQDDPDLGAVARLAQQLLAAVHLPRAISDPDELPIGGVSDIVNRGPLDRLLLSELAHDDLTLSVRVAMNEALFLRRESPPRTPPRGRKVLLDAGLRTWGVPRVFVSAVGLALAAQSDDKLQVSTFTAAGGAAEPADFQTQHGMAQHLSILDHRLHPAESLAALAAAPNSDDEECDLVLVTTEDTLEDHDFQRALYEAGPLALYLATVSRNGQFRLIQRTFRGSKVLAQARFDLDEILRPRPKRPKLLDGSRDPELPAIFSVPLPLRLSVPVDVERSWFVHPGTVLSYTRDGRLLLWDSPQHGARQIAEGLPSGSLLWCDSEWRDDTLQLVLGKRSRRGLVSLTYDRRLGELDFVTLQLSGDQPQAVVGRAGYAYVFCAQGLDVLSLATGELETNHELSQYPGVKSLFVARDPPNRRRWSVLAYDPSSRLQALHTVFTETDKIKLIGMFHSVGREGPVGITEKGEILDPVTGRLTTPTFLRYSSDRVSGPPYTLESVSRDGQRALLRGSFGHVTLDLPNNTLHALLAYKPSMTLEHPLLSLAHDRVLRSRFTWIGIGRERQLVLVSRRSGLWPITYDASQGALRFPKTPVDGLLLEKLRFAAVPGVDRGYALDVVEWPDGSRACLDGRGLLHLKSSDPDIPQCSLILTDGPMAGWLSNGRVFGPAYWHQGQTSIPERVVWDDVLQKFAERIA